MSIHRRTTKRGTSYDVRYREGTENRSRSFTTKADAQAFEAEVRRRRRMGAHAPADPSPMPLSNFLEHWVRTSGPTWAVTTLRTRAAMLDKWVVPYIGTIPLRDLGRGRIREWRADIVRDGSPPVNTNNVTRCLSAALGRAVDEGLLPANPCHRIGLMRTTKPDRRALAGDAVVAMLDAMPTDRDRLVVALMAYAGLRPAEVVALRWADLEDGVVWIRASVQEGREEPTKGFARRTVPVEPELAQVLEQSRPQWTSADDLVAPPVRGTYLNWPMWNRKVWRPARDRVGVVAVPYDLRHTAASTWIIRDRLDLLTVAARLGHDPAVTLEHYAHLLERSRQPDARTTRPSDAVAPTRPARSRRSA
jgi:integrase